MKRSIILATFVLLTATAAAAQKTENAAFEAMEKSAWDAFSKGDGKHFQTFLADEALVSTGTKFSTKAETVTEVSSKPCAIKSYSFADFKTTMLNANTALVTYTATQDGSCGTMTLPAKVLGSSVYVKRGGKWLAAFHTETPVM